MITIPEAQGEMTSKTIDKPMNKVFKIPQKYLALQAIKTEPVERKCKQ